MQTSGSLDLLADRAHRTCADVAAERSVVLLLQRQQRMPLAAAAAAGGGGDGRPQRRRRGGRRVVCEGHDWHQLDSNDVAAPPEDVQHMYLSK